MPYAKLDEIELYYEEAGEGYPIVLGHGGFSDITEWDPQVEALSKRFRVIRYDPTRVWSVPAQRRASASRAVGGGTSGDSC